MGDWESITENKHHYLMNSDWKRILSELWCAQELIDNIDILTSCRNIHIIKTPNGLKWVMPDCILGSAHRTLVSAFLCARYGNLADTHMLIRKARDDLFFYLYVIVACDPYIFSNDNINNCEKKVYEWSQNNLSNLNIKTIIDSILGSEKCRELADQFNLNNELKTIGRTLNDYTHGNGVSFYNRDFETYSQNELQEVADELIHMLNYILVTFIFLLIFISPHNVSSTDFVDALDCGMIPEEGSQYHVAPFINKYLHDNSDLLGENTLNYLREKSIMEF